ncbi:hypothetical protein [Paraliomyxa miuraensis]|uniref:hypothetical protein n=1 Tax=Paraliomyxa miuraensis TaxID=376150 RepID=UPI00224F03E3|nr:hypothetical protein [Paraliomyxa miuraensis]MCX4239941.1 hypothetical protein [Paraliomyxa miuraensis]
MIASRWSTVGALLGVAMTGSCTEVGGSGSSQGELGYGSFRWQCAGAGDITCVEGRVTGFPTKVALGSEVEMSFGLGSSVPVRTGWLELAGSSRARELSRSSNPSYDYIPDCDLDYDFDCDPVGATARYQAQESGLVSVLGLADDGTVADFVTLSIAPATSLAVVRADAYDGDVVTHGDVGATIDLRVEPYASGQLLVGHLDYSWVSLEPSVAAFVSTEGHLATLELRQAGTAYVQVQGGGREDTIAIEVLSSNDGPERRPPGGDSADETEGGTTDAGTDTASGSDSGTATGETSTETGTGSTGGMQ